MNLFSGPPILTIASTVHRAVPRLIGAAFGVGEPVWELGWFQLLASLALTALLVAVARWSLGRLLAQNRRLKNELDQRTSNLRETKALLESEVEQRKRAESELGGCAPAQELYKSQARFQAIFENAAVGIAVMTLERLCSGRDQLSLNARVPLPR